MIPFTCNCFRTMPLLAMPLLHGPKHNSYSLMRNIMRVLNLSTFGPSRIKNCSSYSVHESPVHHSSNLLFAFERCPCCLCLYCMASSIIVTLLWGISWEYLIFQLLVRQESRIAHHILYMKVLSITQVIYFLLSNDAPAAYASTAWPQA